MIVKRTIKTQHFEKEKHSIQIPIMLYKNTKYCKFIKIDSSLRIMFIWFDYKGNCSLCGSLFPLGLFAPSVPDPGKLCFHL